MTRPASSATETAVGAAGTRPGPHVAGAEDLPARLLAVLEADPRLLPRGSAVLVAYSGGPDSTALLHLLSILREGLDLRLHAAHFDHGIRPGSPADATACVEAARRLGIECAVGRPARSLAVNQAALRSARYAFLREEAHRRGAARIVTAHHADDVAETVLFRLTRGTGLAGLAGIPMRRGRIVRPLLRFRRSAVLAWLTGRTDASWLQDPGNEDLRWARVRVRRQLIPALAAGGADPVPALLRLAALADEADTALDRLAAGLLQAARVGETAAGDLRLDRARLLAATPEMRARVLRLAAAERGSRLGRGGTRAGVEFMSRGRSGGEVHPGGSLRLRRCFEELRLGPLPASAGRPEPPGGEREEPGLCLSGSRGRGVARVGARSLTFRWSVAQGSAAERGEGAAGRVAVHVSAEHYPLRIRGWEPGDRIRVRGRTRKLKKLFAERRVPREERALRCVLADRSGRVLWVEGIATASDAGAVPHAENLVIEFEDA